MGLARWGQAADGTEGSDVATYAELGLGHPRVDIRLQPARIIRITIAHLPSIIQDITCLPALVGGAEILDIVEQRLGDVFGCAQPGAQRGDRQHQRIGVGRTGGIFIVDVDAIQSILRDGIGALHGKRIGGCISGETTPACVLMVAQNIQQDFYTQGS